MHTLKRSLLTLALAAGCASTALLAQPPEHPPGAAPGEHGGKERGPGGPGMRGDRLKQLSEALGLTEEQKTQLKPIVTEEAAALKAIWDDKSLSREASREKMKTVRDSFAGKIEAILTPEQKAKFEKLKALRGPGGSDGPRRDREEKK